LKLGSRKILLWEQHSSCSSAHLPQNLTGSRALAVRIEKQKSRHVQLGTHTIPTQWYEKPKLQQEASL